MKVIADLCVVPIGVGVSVSAYVVACERALESFDVETSLAAVKRCHEVVHEMGAPRISSTLRFGTRTDREQSMADKVTSVTDKLAGGDH